MKICGFCDHRFDSARWVCPGCGGKPEEHDGFISLTQGTVVPGESFEPEYFKELYRLENDSFWFRHRARLITKSVTRFFPPAGRVLEIGCGTGLVLSEIRKMFPGMAVSGSDLFTEGLRFARKRANDVPLYQMDALRMPFVEEFDLVLALDIIEHIENDWKALNEICRSVRPGGGVIITVPQHPWLWTIQDEKAFHKRRYTRSELVEKMEAQGLRVAYVTSFITLLLPAMVLSRLYGRYLTWDTDVCDHARELKIHPMLNDIMQSVCSVEEVILETGMSLPVGGSLLCVGIKEG